MEDQLQNDLDYVRNILDSPRDASKSTHGQSLWTVISRPSLSHADKRKEEIAELRRQVDILKAKLLEAQQNATGKPNMSLWERAARNQIYAYSIAIQENQRLQANVSENAIFIEELESTLRKRPRLLLDVHAEEWKAYKLSAQASLRVVAIHAIADRHYSQLEAAFIRAGVFQCSDEIIRDEHILQSDGWRMPERVYNVTLATPFRLIGAAVWRVLSGEHSIPLPEGAEETLEKIDPFTVYQIFRNTNETNAAYINLIYKYYVEVDREVIVWRSVLEDELVPQMKKGHAHNKWGWVVIVPTNDPTTCRITYLQQITPVKLHKTWTQAERAERKRIFVEKYGIIQPPEIPGTFPGGAVKHDIEIPIPFTGRTFIERDKAVDWAIKGVIDNVVLSYRQSNSATG
ncbi:hypothetical protein AeMF1_005962 [Aphanomyces euteiches]|nr:hypothetical protein AeMF1_005962 [Aphanomyces euteiches]KAH9183078.1 hypothetical protein AeNC1_014946 [Aphanomyces euteiches]